MLRRKTYNLTAVSRAGGLPPATVDTRPGAPGKHALRQRPTFRTRLHIRPVKFQPDTLTGVNLITRHEPGRLWVGSAAHAGSVLVPWVGNVLPWAAPRFEALSEEHFEQIALLQPEVVIFGSGLRLRFPPAAWLRPLIERRIGIETMDTAAACRTYNVLASEQRSVVAAMLSAAAHDGAG
jgi:uncharacterized protein